MNKKGFTLIEILAVIAVIGILLLLIVPNVKKILGQSIDKTMRLQENELKEAGLLYLEDYCKNPIGRNRCTLTRNSDYTYSGQIPLTTLTSDVEGNGSYIDNIFLEGKECTGCVVINSNKATAYISCPNDGSLYQTEGYSCN